MTHSRRFVHVVEAKHLGDHRVWLRFDDGVAGELNLAAELEGEIFAPLRDPTYFARFRIDEGRTLAWSNGADFAPEFLHEMVTRSAVRTPV